MENRNWKSNNTWISDMVALFFWQQSFSNLSANQWKELFWVWLLCCCGLLCLRVTPLSPLCRRLWTWILSSEGERNFRNTHLCWLFPPPNPPTLFFQVLRGGIACCQDQLCVTRPARQAVCGSSFVSQSGRTLPGLSRRALVWHFRSRWKDGDKVMCLLPSDS